ncbi:vacuolar membrane protein [Ephemerocybe angulata]|uniref:Vacuolar membrane protein n=1 Tax=Ephemerocybe angulata TaxID=980116 RepID=A0A8H6IKH1_9AGAR|nr:vacuolar membrane protein [Tulosesus angulatus]
MPSSATALNPLRNDRNSSHHPAGEPVNEVIEMDTLPQAPTHGRSLSRGRRSMSMLRGGKSVEPLNRQAALNKKDYAIGILLLLSVVVLWTSSNFITQDLFEEGYDKPFFVTYMNTSAFSLYLIPFLIKRLWKKYRGEASDDSRGASEEYRPLATSDDNDETESMLKPDTDDLLAPLTIKETAQLAIIFCFFWFIANWAVNASLNFTSVASTTVLSSMSGFFTLGIGRLFKVESLTVLKIGAVVTSFVGVFLVSWADTTSTKQLAGPASRPNASQITNHAPRPALGDALALISALFYALYVILLKVRIKNESRVDMQLFFGFVGLFNVLTCWPIGVVLHLTGAEVFELPSTRAALSAVLINMAITLSSDYLYVLAMLKTTPLVVTVGLSLTIPFAVVGDFIRGRPSTGKIIFGAGLVLLSFIAIGFDNQDAEEEREEGSSESHDVDRQSRTSIR